MKKAISLLLSVIMMVSVTAGIDMSAYAVNSIYLPDVISAAVDIDINTGKSDCVNDSCNTKYYKITAPSDGKLRISFDHVMVSVESIWDAWNVSVFDSLGQLLLEQEMICGDEKAKPFFLLATKKDACYYVVVESASEDNAISGVTYTVSNTFEPTYGDYETEYNDSTETANIFPLNSSISGTVFDRDLCDYYKISTTKPGKLSVSFSHLYNEVDSIWDAWTVTIFDSLGQIVDKREMIEADSREIEKFYTWGADANSTFYVKVERESDGVDDVQYKLTNTFEETNGEYEIEYNDYIETANVFKANSSISGNVFEANPKDYYKVRSSINGLMNIVFSHPKVERYYYGWQVTVLDELGQTLASESFEGVTTAQTIKNIRVKANSTYYICIELETDYVNGVQYTMSNEILPHTHNYVTVEYQKATCTKTGYKKSKCDCGEIRNQTIPRKAHTYKSYVTTPATTSSMGKITTKCSVCGAVKSTQTIARISSVKLSGTSYKYDGKVKTPSVTVKNVNGKTLVKNTDYTVSYPSGRKNVGKYAVKVKFKGKYSGTKTLYFTIKPKATGISSLTAKSKGFTVKWYKRSTQTTGYQVQYSTSSKFTSPKTVTISKTGTTSKTVSKLKAKKKYYVRVRTYKTVNGTRYYSSWSKAKYVTTKK